MARKSSSLMAPPPKEPLVINFADALKDRYLAYALSTIMARSLPDVRDGLKPVHRRLLYAMQQLKLDPASGYKKAARVVGDVVGKFHPHGEQSIYDALVRLAQDFAQRYPLVDGHGNFGNIDGDNAAAMRYTEARLTPVAAAMLAGIDEDAVDFRWTYDGEGMEPVILPAGFPNLLANGAQGIAVGMATSIPPHNVGEICDALLHLVKYPNARAEKLVELIPGPDFPTGGLIVESPEAILESYKTGRGSFRLRAKWEVERHKGGGYSVIVTEIPYQVAKGRLIEKIAELLHAKKLPLLDDIRDESTADVRLILVPKNRNVEPEILMESLFRTTDLEVRIGLNMNVLDPQNTPRVMSLAEVLRAFLDHRRDVLLRRGRHRLVHIEERLETLEGYRVAYLNIDAVIRIIRKEDEPKPILIKKYELTERQAEAILNLRLRSLRKLEEMEIRAEHVKLSSERKELKALLAEEGRQWQAISAEVNDLKKQFGRTTPGGERRTQFAVAPDVAQMAVSEALVEREPVTVICSAKGWIRTIKGHIQDQGDIRYKEGDRGRFLIPAETTDKLILFATNGRFYTLSVDKLPGGRGHGEPVRLMIDLSNDHDIIAILPHLPDRKLLIAATSGKGFIVPENEVLAQTRVGKQVLTLADGDEAKIMIPVAGDTVAIVGDNRKLLLFPVSEIPQMTKGRGVQLQKYKDGGLADAKVFHLREGLSWRAGENRQRNEQNLESWLGHRAQAGRLPPNGFPRTNRFT